MTPQDAANQPKRFYASVAAVADGDAWRIELDGRAVKTPARATMTVPSETLAKEVATEWADQDETLNIQSMHLTRLANVAVDRTPQTREALADEVAKYCETDLLCHLADGPAPLRDRQDMYWRPVREWAGKALSIVLVPVEGIVASVQPPASLEAARAHALSLDDYRLTGLAFGCGLFGSALLALALEQGTIDAQDAFEASRIDETFQAEQWGEDDDATAAATARLVEALALGVWFAAL